MFSDQMARVLRLLQLDDWPQGVDDVTVAGAKALGADGLAVSLVTEAGTTELLWCSDATTRRFEDLQLTLGQGPGPEAVRTGAMVWVPDLAHVRHARWPRCPWRPPTWTPARCSASRWASARSASAS